MNSPLLCYGHRGTLVPILYIRKDATMVATRSAEDVVTFVTGRRCVKPEDINPEQWTAIILAAIRELPISRMRGLRSVKEVLSYDGSYGVRREIEYPMPDIWCEGPQSRVRIRPSDVFLDCAIHGGEFPRGDYLTDVWKNAPRRTRGKTSELLPLQAGYFLLSRDGKLFHLDVTWRPIEKWDERSDFLSKFWYFAEKILPSEVSEEGLLRRLTYLDGPSVGEQMLRRFNMMMNYTVNDLQDSYHYMMRCQQATEGYLQRIGKM